MTASPAWTAEQRRAHLRDFQARGGRPPRLSRAARRVLSDIAWQSFAEHDYSPRWHRAALELAAAGCALVRVNGERWLALKCTAEGSRRDEARR